MASSYDMEKEGLLRVLNFLQFHNLKADVLVTDKQVA